ncbi:MAG: TonB family protein [Pseudomonadota bacterium]
MERPSHISFAQQSLSHRLPLVGLALGFQMLVFWMFSQGVGMKIVEIFRGPLEVTFQKTQPSKTPPPTEPKMETIKSIVPIKPIFDEAPERGERNTVNTTPFKPAHETPPQPVIERAPVRVAATNTIPPYPVVARRLGWEGTVTLRLQVTEAGRVARADIVTSSGYGDLDQTAQSWVVSHWTYRPATRGGEAVSGQVLARVQFTLDGR